MPIGLPAPPRISQLAENALEEEQYDIAIACMAQMSQLGRQPTSDLLRSLVAISLCSLPRTSGKKKGSAIARPMSRKTLERIAPTATMVTDARILLEKLGKQGLYDSIFEAILPVLSRKSDEGDKSKNKRSRSTYEQASDDDESLESLSDSSPVGQFGRKMIECQNIWQIMALGDMMEPSGSKGRRQSSNSRRKDELEGREGEESILSNDVYDREGVWGVLEVFLKCWKNEDKKRQITSHFSEQFIEAPQRDRTSRKDRTPSTYVGEVFDVIYAGLCSNSLIKPESEEGKSAKMRKNEKYKREEIAISLIKQVFELVKARHLDKQAVLRATANLVEKIDASTMIYLSMGMHRGYEFEWVEVVFLGLGSSEGKWPVDFPLDEYQECIAEIKSIKKMPKASISFYKDIMDSVWLRATPRNENEMALTEFFDGNHDKKEIASFARNSTIKALLAEKWRMTTASKQSKSAKDTLEMTWEQASFAAAWRRATMQAVWKCIELKMQIFTTICMTHNYTKGIPSSVKAWKRLREICIKAILEPVVEQEKIMKECCAEMEKSYEQMKGEQIVNGKGKTHKVINLDGESDSEHEQEAGQEEVDWKKEMRRHVEACLELSNKLAEQIRLHKVINDKGGKKKK